MTLIEDARNLSDRVRDDIRCPADDPSRACICDLREQTVAVLEAAQIVVDVYYADDTDKVDTYAAIRDLATALLGQKNPV